MLEFLQDAAVTLAALGAVIVVVRRVVLTVRPAGSEPKCASCPSAREHGRTPPRLPASPGDARPLTLVRDARR